jgi:hypothetical protein
MAHASQRNFRTPAPHRICTILVTNIGDFERRSSQFLNITPDLRRAVVNFPSMRGGRPLIFLSYAREDELTVARIYEKLRAAGFRPWMDVKDIPPGEEWRLAIESAIDRAASFLAFLSPRSVQKAGVLREEIEAARRRRSDPKSPLKVIPIRLEPCETPASVSDLQWVDLFDPDGWDRLLKALGRPRSAIMKYAVAAAVLAIVATAAIVALRQRAEPTIGATFWRLEPSSPSDPPTVRSIFQPPARAGVQPTDYTPARIGLDSHLKSGDLFYVSIESAREGYVYVVDRERYANGGAGEPELIFPTLRTRGGDNYLQKNALMRLPSVNDNPPWFEVQSGSAAYEGEIFTVIVLPRPLPGFTAPADHIQVPAGRFSDWQRNWQRTANLVSSDSQRVPITESEARAHRSTQPVIQSERDPAQATVYRIPPGTGGGLWADFILPVEK